MPAEAGTLPLLRFLVEKHQLRHRQELSENGEGGQVHGNDGGNFGPQATERNISGAEPASALQVLLAVADRDGGSAPASSSQQDERFGGAALSPTSVVGHDDASALTHLRHLRKYLESTAGEPFEKLLEEPERLRTRQGETRSAMQSLAWDHYGQFVGASDCVHSVATDVALVNGHAAELLDECLPRMTTVSQQFVERARELRERKETARGTLAHHAALQEVLELAPMMESCVKSGLYDEALALDAYSRKLVRAFPQSRVVAGIRAQVLAEGDNMLGLLHAELRSDAQLPQCLRIIGYLRRLGASDSGRVSSAFNHKAGDQPGQQETDSEYSLRRVFLASRGLWLQRSLDAIPSANPYTYLTKLTDASRTHIFDIITQYRAIFVLNNDTGNAGSATGSSTRSAPDRQPSTDALLHTWIAGAVTRYVAAVSQNLPLINEGLALSNILDQCMYYGHSLARVGADFRPLLIPHFEDAVLRMTSNAVTAAAAHFSESLRAHSLDAIPPSAAFGEDGDSENGSTGENDFRPPQRLLRHPPVAVLCNGYLATLNELRHCAPLALQAGIVDVFRDSLSSGATSVATLVLQLEQSRQREEEAKAHDRNRELVAAKAKAERDAQASLAMCFAEDLIPYVGKCLHAVFGAESSEEVLNASSAKAVLEPLYSTFAKEQRQIQEERARLSAAESQGHENALSAAESQGLENA